MTERTQIPTTVILGSARTPIGKLGGALASVEATRLGAIAIAGALERSEVSADQVEHVVMGTVLQAGQGQIPSRQAQCEAGIPVSVSSETLNKVCASGMRAVSLLDTAIRAGDLEVGVGGGMESMSRAPYLLEGARFGLRMGNATARDSMLRDGLESPWSGKHMAAEATEVAAELEITRPDMDRWALRSHQRATAAIDAGTMAEEIVAVAVNGRGGEVVVATDEAPRRDTTLEALARLEPIFVADGSHTAGNSPGVNDGAGAIVVASERWARSAGCEPLATIISTAQAADELRYLARTPALAARKALAKAGLEPSQVDLWEINEAFASVTLHSIRMLGIDEERVNVNGGAVALGHPIGASGARILGALVHELRRRGGGLGCAAICSGGAQGDAVVVRV
jgi:acetyl-CoA C-acetyltransferase